MAETTPGRVQPGQDISVDVLIVGGGLSGLPLAISLAKAGVAVAVVDREPPPSMLSPSFDWRTTAIAYGAQQILDAMGVWPYMAETASPILDIRVADAGSTLFVHYDHQAVGTNPFGWVIENQKFRRALFAAMPGLSSLHHLAPASVDKIERNANGVAATLGDGRTIRARLLVGADGRNSPIREQAGIKTLGWAYDQESIVCNVEHERPHEGVAIEHFFAGGPFAILPLTANRSSIVWTDQKDRVRQHLALSDADFDAEIATRFGPYLGQTKVVSPRDAYPLRMFVTPTLIGERLALIGDAGHIIHPIAGQGLNLGLRDVAELAALIIDSCRLGLDPGRSSLLAQYERKRRPDILALAGVTDGLNRLFSNDVLPVKVVRRLGLGLVNLLPAVKAPLMRHAMGIAGRV